MIHFYVEVYRIVKTRQIKWTICLTFSRRNYITLSRLHNSENSSKKKIKFKNKSWK